MIVKKMTISAFLAAVLLLIKYVFGFIAGFEIVTTIIILYAILLPLSLSTITVSTFIILTGAIYGFGPWWLIYWPMFLSNVLLTWLIRRSLRASVSFAALWSFAWGFSNVLWYFGLDYIMFGWGAALAFFGTSLLFSIIGATGNFIATVVLFNPTVSLFEKRLLIEGPGLW